MATLSKQNDVSILKIDGALSRVNVDEFRRMATEAMADDARDFVVDFSGCMSIDSAGLEALTWLNRECEERLGMAKLCALDEDMRKILELTRLDKQLDVLETLDDAMAALK